MLLCDYPREQRWWLSKEAVSPLNLKIGYFNLLIENTWYNEYIKSYIHSLQMQYKALWMVTGCFKSFHIGLFELKVTSTLTLWFLSSAPRVCIWKKSCVADCCKTSSSSKRKTHSMDHWRSRTSNQARFTRKHHSRTSSALWIIFFS